MVDRARLGRRSRQKGKLAQKIVAKKIADALEVEEDDVRSCVGGKKGFDEADILMPNRVKALYPFHTEVKNCKQISIKQWVKQAEKEAGWRIPTVVFHVHGEPTDKFHIVLPFDKWLEAAAALARQTKVAMGTTKSPHSSSIIREQWREIGIHIEEESDGQ